MRTNDGVRLHYLERGQGTPLVMVPGWSQTAEQFRHQLAGLGDRYRVIALDMPVWIHEQIPGSRLVVFEAEEGGGHVTFLENPTKFNQTVAEFVG